MKNLDRILLHGKLEILQAKFTINPTAPTPIQLVCSNVISNQQAIGIQVYLPTVSTIYDISLQSKYFAWIYETLLCPLVSVTSQTKNSLT